jgi:regulator of cell morphogenesis and NO signaling
MAAINLDVRTIPPREKHPAIFRTFDALPPGEGFTLINDHDPFPLRHQFNAVRSNQFTWDYLERGPVVWRVRIEKNAGQRSEAMTTLLDVREVAPKDRLQTILGAYSSLAQGALLQLTVDHDPSCMYYTLAATEPQGSFSFDVTEHGPELWRAEVKKL